MNRIVKRILLVEPDGVLAEVTAFRLELLGYQVEIVANSEIAFKRVLAMGPDLIITDLELDGTDAIPLIERLASDEQTNHIPIMVLSLDADLDRVTAVHKVGAADFLVVPFQPDVLQGKVAKLLSNPRKRAESKDPAASVAG